MIIFLLKNQGLTINGAIKTMNIKTKKLDDINSSSIKEQYLQKSIKIKSKKILQKIKNLNGKKNTYQG